MLTFFRVLLFGRPNHSPAPSMRDWTLLDTMMTAHNELRSASEPAVRMESLTVLTKQHPPHIQRLVEEMRANFGITPEQVAVWEEELSQMIAETTGA